MRVCVCVGVGGRKVQGLGDKKGDPFFIKVAAHFLKLADSYCIINNINHFPGDTVTSVT